VSGVVCTEDSILASSVDGTFRQFDLRIGESVVDHVCRPITSLRLTAHKDCVLLGCLDNKIRLFDKNNGEMLNSFKGHVNKDFPIGSLTSNTDTHVISGSEDNDIVIWDLVDAKIVHKLKGHTMPVCSVDYHPRETLLLSSSFDGTIRCWQ